MTGNSHFDRFPSNMNAQSSKAPVMSIFQYCPERALYSSTLLYRQYNLDHKTSIKDSAHIILQRESMSQVRLNISFSIQNLEEEKKKTLTANEWSGICQCLVNVFKCSDSHVYCITLVKSSHTALWDRECIA